MKQLYKNKPEIQLLFVQDMVNGHFLIFTDGWKVWNREYECFCHIEVKKDGKIGFRSTKNSSACR
ncbi:MAG: hypothetical protein RIS64_1702 [Bacteroidota bacterium]|jgi:hypothetical protein